jgi:hypothetical protein
MKARRSVVWMIPALLSMGGCATAPKTDYSEFLQAKPATILVLPPVNDSPDLKASPAVWSHATRPLAEAGYYVYPAALVDETFRENGLTMPTDIQQVAPQKLREVFGADAGLYLHVSKDGTSYAVISSETRVTVEARLVDLRTGKVLWSGSATSSSAEGQQNQGGIIGALIGAVVRQIFDSVTEAGYKYSAITDDRLLGAPRANGILTGPRSPAPWQVPATQQ